MFLSSVTTAIFGKLLAESLLSLYPTLVKNTSLSIGLQIWTRFITHFLFSGFFIDYSFIYHSLLSKSGVLLSLVTILHVYTSYRGFQLLEGGIAYALFYTYPFMILGMANKPVSWSVVPWSMVPWSVVHWSMVPWSMGLAVFGMILLYFVSRDTDNKKDEKNKKEDNPKQESEIKSIEKTPFEIHEGYGMILMAAFTEACIYFLVRDIQTTNHWNHLFLSYFLGSLVFTGYFSTEIIKNTVETNNISISLILNTAIGLFGHLLRFYSMSNLSAALYAPLSYFGIVMATMYGILFNQESANELKLLGILCIIISNVITVFQTRYREI